MKLGQKYKNIFVGFSVQMKTLKFAFKINWPLEDDRTATTKKEIKYYKQNISNQIHTGEFSQGP